MKKIAIITSFLVLLAGVEAYAQSSSEESQNASDEYESSSEFRWKNPDAGNPIGMDENTGGSNSSMPGLGNALGTGSPFGTNPAITQPIESEPNPEPETINSGLTGVGYPTVDSGVSGMGTPVGTDQITGEFIGINRGTGRLPAANQSTRGFMGPSVGTTTVPINNQSTGEPTEVTPGNGK
ncbi:MAG: hypothetical protein ABSH12_06485 [Endomicrobiales bacterium]